MRLTETARCLVKRAPARTPNAKATARNTRCETTVRRACRAASAGTCSTKVLLLHSVLPHNRRRTRNLINTSRPAIEVSDNRRW